jgi:hypothetical protein
VLAAGGDSLVGWQTHQPVLVELFRHLQAPRVLEAGIGYASTPLVLQLARESVSLETNPRWHRRFARFADDRHRILLVEDEASEPWLDEEWDLAFVDGSGTSRQACVDRLAERTRFVVCHDTEELFKPSAANFGWDFSRFEHVWTYTQFPNYTTVASTTEPIPLTHLTGIAGPPPPRSS